MSIEVENRGTTRIIHMRSGENRMNRHWLDDVNGALDEIEADPDAAALVTTGEGKFYSNGLDLDWLLHPSTEPMVAFVADAEKLLARLLALPMATVAACNGHAFAAGAMFALCHDFRVMRADRGFFCLPEVDLGIPFTAGMDSLIKSHMLPTTAHEVMVTGKRYGGMEALEKQIVHAAVPESEVLPAAISLAEENGGKDRVVLGTIKRRMYAETIDLLSSSEGTQPVL
jgi:enoyl-CoA hydratase/carnithine racemase